MFMVFSITFDDGNYCSSTCKIFARKCIREVCNISWCFYIILGHTVGTLLLGKKKLKAVIFFFHSDYFNTQKENSVVDIQ